MKKVAVLQSNYIPWKGYFDIIHDVDEFIFYDEVQFTKNDWRNRNRISTASGIQWLTIPTTGSITQSIDEVQTAGSQWQRKHYNTLVTNYSKAPFFSQYKDFLEDFYLEKTWSNLSQLNQYLITHIAHDFLGIKTTFSNSRDYESSGSGHEKLLSLLISAGAEYYIGSLPGGSTPQDEYYCLKDMGYQLVFTTSDYRNIWTDNHGHLIIVARGQWAGACETDYSLLTELQW